MPAGAIYLSSPGAIRRRDTRRDGAGHDDACSRLFRHFALVTDDARFLSSGAATPAGRGVSADDDLITADLLLLALAARYHLARPISAGR